jgi:hypothetical protein
MIRLTFMIDSINPEAIDYINRAIQEVVRTIVQKRDFKSYTIEVCIHEEDE